MRIKAQIKRNSRAELPNAGIIMDAHICAMETNQHKASADYINLVLEKTGLNGNQLSKKAGLKAPSTVNRPISDKPGEHPPSLKTLMKIRQVTGVSFTADVIRAYNLPLDMAAPDTGKVVPFGNARSPAAEVSRSDPGVFSVWKIKTFQLRDGSILIQFWDDSAPRSQVQVPLEEIHRFRDELAQY